MRPKAPKGGKRIFLEKYPAIWKRLSFNSKVTLRNVLRNKKRFFMAVLGVTGCTALMVAGFGLQYSIKTALNEQFLNEDCICAYDMQVVLNGSYDTTVEMPSAVNAVASRPEIATSMLNYMKVLHSLSVNSDAKLETYLMVPENADMLSNYIRLFDSKTGNPLSLPAAGAIITQKLAEELNLSVGDYIQVEVSEGYVVPVPVAGVAKNYIFHYIFMSKDAYSSLFAGNPRYNYIMTTFSSELTGVQKEALSKTLMEEYDITAVSYVTEAQDTFRNVLTSLNYVVLILVVSAGLLSFIVLYNLSSINIHERMKEIATIKVLGFRKKEVTAYIFRENVLLSVFGTLLGLVLGIVLHRMVVAVGEVDILMFGRHAGLMCFVYSAALSMVYSLLVNVALRRNIEHVSMVDSLKSIE